jgi:two-component system response regulator YesN
MRRILSFIRRNLTNDLSRSVLAHEMGVTPQYMNPLFRKELGMTPSELVNRERVHFASRLMAAEGLSVKEAAARAGYNDQFYFSRVFKRIMNYPPSRSA